MVHQCYMCDQIFDSKEKLIDHLEIHVKTRLSPLDEYEIITDEYTDLLKLLGDSASKLSRSWNLFRKEKILNQYNS